jgi:hypothetical protein
MSEDFPTPFDNGVAGKSAGEEYERRVRAREDRLKRNFGSKLGSFLSFVLTDSKNTEAWDKGRTGEIAVGATLNELAEENGWFVLHDRKIVGSKANIDHILITDRGIFVVDAKNMKGKIEVRTEGGILSRKEALFLEGRNQSRLIEGVRKQVSLVELALLNEALAIPVRGLLAFVGGEFSIFFKPTEVDGILINGKGIKRSILEQPLLHGNNLKEINSVLIEAFPAK